MKTTTEIKAMRFWAPTVTTDGRYNLLDARGRVVMFDLTLERAQEFAVHYKGAQIVEAR